MNTVVPKVITILVMCMTYVCADEYEVGVTAILPGVSPRICLGLGEQSCTENGDTIVSVVDNYEGIPCYVPGVISTCQERETVTNEVWKGTAPFCNPSATACDDACMDEVLTARCDSRDGTCCWTGLPEKKLCYPRDGEVPMEVSHTNSGLECAMCDVFGFICNSTTELELDQLFLDGDHARCLPPPPVPLCDTEYNEFTVISYNVYEIPYPVGQFGQRERLCRIPNRLLEEHPGVDVIIFQEVFKGGCGYEFGVSLKDLLAANGFIYSTTTVGDPPEMYFRPYNGGVFIASRWPILEESSTTFDPVPTEDIYLTKGVAYAKIEKSTNAGSKVYHIFGTHFQFTPSGTDHADYDTIRVLQSQQMAQFMTAQNIPQDEPVILGGDLNVDSIKYSDHRDELFDIIGATVPPIIGDLDTTFDPVINQLPGEGFIGAIPEWLDYVLTLNAHQQPSSSSLEAFRLVSHYDDPIMYCYPDMVYTDFIFPPISYSPEVLAAMCTFAYDLSDHFPVIGTFTFQN
ncbi:sphingomyelinase C-like [Saccoglossus kowalevskii]